MSPEAVTTLDTMVTPANRVVMAANGKSLPETAVDRQTGLSHQRRRRAQRPK